MTRDTPLPMVQLLQEAGSLAAMTQAAPPERSRCRESVLTRQASLRRTAACSTVLLRWGILCSQHMHVVPTGCCCSAMFLDTQELSVM